MSEAEEKHFNVTYGKVLGIPVGSAEPITPEGKRILTKYFIPFFAAIGLGVIFINANAYFFLACWCIAAFTSYLFIRQLKHTAIFERQYFSKHDQE